MIRLTLISTFLYIFAGVVVGQDDLIRVKTELVSIPVTVTDRDGRFLADLRRENFSVFENGTVQEIEYFGAVDSPVTVMVVLDASASMVKHVEKLGQAATAFIRKLRSADHVIVARFSDRPEIILPRVRRDSLPNNLELLVMGGGTKVYDAMAFSIEYMKRIEGRKAIVLFTDGESENDRSSPEENLAEAEENEALVYTVRFGEFKSRMRHVTNAPDSWNGMPTTETTIDPLRKHIEAKNKQIEKYMTGLADKTGGRAFRIEKIQDLDKTFGKIVDELTRQYTLGYYPQKDASADERRTLSIKVNVKNAAVRSRREVVFRKKAPKN
jgi:Ca-activated chloride channel homolog